MMKTKTKIIGIILIVILGISFIPFDTIFIPEWRLRLVDENGNPWNGQYVAQHCTNYTLGIHPCEGVQDASQITDENGFVVFPERRIRANLLYRVIRPIIGLALLVINGEFGTNGYITTSGPYGSRMIDFEPEGPLPTEIVLTSKEAKSVK